MLRPTVMTLSPTNDPTVDSYDGESWSDRSVETEQRAQRHGRYEDWITHEVVEWIYADCGGRHGVQHGRQQDRHNNYHSFH